MADIVIKGRSYSCEPMPVTVTLPLGLRLLKHFGPLFAARGDGMNALGEVLTSLDDAETASIVQDLVALAKCNGQPCVFGVNPYDLNETIQVALFAGEVLYGPFLQDALARIEEHKAKADQA